MLLAAAAAAAADYMMTDATRCYLLHTVSIIHTIDRSTVCCGKG